MAWLARRRRRRTRPALLLWGLALLAPALWAAGLAHFVSLVPAEPVADDAARSPGAAEVTDAVVVLTGGSLRLEAGFDLLGRGLGRHLFISGVYRGTDVAQLLALARRPDSALECCITLGYEADDTVGNARESARWMRANGYRSMRLVTAHYHMPRSLLEFRRQMPDARIVPHPVFPATVSMRGWHLRWGTARLVMWEYAKWLVAGARAWVPAA